MSGLFIWSASDARGSENLEYGLATRTWGFKHDKPDYHQPADWVIFGRHHSGGSVRTDAASWQAGTVDVVLCEFTAPYYVGSAPHWPDEVASGTVTYPHRIGITPVGMATSVSAATAGPLGAAGTEALRLAASSNRGVRAAFNVSALAAAVGITLTTSGQTALSATPGLPSAGSGGSGGSGQGRSTDKQLTDAVEKHAVALAKAHMSGHGWSDIKDLGKPYDLVCRNTAGEEKHVEVKGTTGAGTDVIYTPNEVRHFRQCPSGADLVVVRDIRVDRTMTPYVASAGELLHIVDYRAPADDLQATEWSGRITGW